MWYEVRQRLKAGCQKQSAVDIIKKLIHNTTGNLITGQQQNSGAKAAELVLQALEEDKKAKKCNWNFFQRSRKGLVS